MPRLRRIVCYSVNGSGLGHVTRLMAVARWVRRYVAFLEGRAPEVLFLTSGEASDLLARAGIASFKIPSKTVVRASGMDPLEYRRLAKQLIWQVLGVFSPDLLLVDTFPSGSFDELFQVLDGPFSKGFIFRDVKAEYAARPTFRAALGLYDVVVVPHRSGDDQPGMRPDELATEVPVTHCGEVVQLDREELLDVDAARRQLGVEPGRRLVYLSGGGGGDPQSEQALGAMVQALGREPDLHLLVGAGPLYRGRRFGGPNLTWFTEPLVSRYFGACDAAISAAGYNTFHELLYLRVPTLFFAQPKIADDQARRVREAETKGACAAVADLWDGPALLHDLRELLRPEVRDAMQQACGRIIPENGAPRCARQLLAPVYDPARLGWAAEVLSPDLVHACERAAGGTLTPLSRWLPRLLPHGSCQLPGGEAALEPVVQQLSFSAAAEVRQALASRPDARDLSACKAALVTLLEIAERVEVSAETALATLDTAIKKHPLSQESHQRRVAWIASLAEGLAGLLEGHEHPGDPAGLLQLYRVFPRLVDADARQAMDLFQATVTRLSGQGLEPHEVVRRLQVLKTAHPRITCQLLAQLEG